MIDFEAKFAEKERERKKLTIEGNTRQYIFGVVDQLNLELRQVIPKDRTPSKEYMYIYEYTDELGRTGRPSTKYKMMLSFLESILEHALAEGQFKIIVKNENTSSDPKKANSSASVGENKNVPPKNGRAEPLSLF